MGATESQLDAAALQEPCRCWRDLWMWYWSGLVEMLGAVGYSGFVVFGGDGGYLVDLSCLGCRWCWIFWIDEFWGGWIMWINGLVMVNGDVWWRLEGYFRLAATCCNVNPPLLEKFSWPPLKFCQKFFGDSDRHDWLGALVRRRNAALIPSCYEFNFSST